MKKRYILYFLIIISVLFICINILCPTNKQFQVTITDIELIEIDKNEVELIASSNKFDDVSLDKTTIADIVKCPDKYKQVRIDYLFENKSSSITMLDLRVNYILSEEFKEEVIAYNDSHLISDIILEPQTMYEFPQYLLLKTNAVTDEEIVGKILKNKCLITYFTGPFARSNGHEYYGIGKKEIIVDMLDIR